MNVGEFLLYTTEDGVAKLEVRLVDETVWLNQKQGEELFQKEGITISDDERNGYGEDEETADATIRNFRKVQTEGRSQVERAGAHYSIEVIISVG